MIKTIYVGIFFIQEDVVAAAEGLASKARLSMLVKNPHVTFAFGKPMSDSFKALLGKEEKVVITGYGNDGMNEGFLVSLRDNSEFTGKIPHITISLAEGAKAVNTANIDFRDTCKKVSLVGRYGWFGSDGQVHFCTEVQEEDYE